jgi:hypothetical protein
MIQGLELNWQDPNLKILDAACGRGNFLLAALEILESHGHTKEHIVRNMLYGIDISKVQSMIAKKALQLASGVEPNISCDNSLTKEWNMDYSAILMNPPYQKDTDFIKDEGNKQGSFYYEFVKLGIDHLEDNGVLMVICPKSIFGSGGFGKKSFKVGEIIETTSFTEIWPDLNAHFNVGIEILGFSAVKNTTKPPVRIAGTADTITIDGKSPVPFYVSKTNASVIQKCFNTGNTTIGFKESIKNSKPTDVVLKVNGGRFKQWKKTYVGINSGTKHSQQGAVLKDTEVLGFQSAVASELWEFMFKAMGGEKGNSVTGLVDRLPVMPDMTKSYTNEEWYSHFGITDQEQADIKTFLENYK